MAEKRMTCMRCPRYDRDARRCLDGKANPANKTDTVAVAELFGPRALCHYNPYRDALAARMYFPNLPISGSKPAKRRFAGRGRIEIEIESTEPEG